MHRKAVINRVRQITPNKPFPFHWKDKVWLVAKLKIFLCPYFFCLSWTQSYAYGSKSALKHENCSKNPVKDTVALKAYTFHLNKTNLVANRSSSVTPIGSALMRWNLFRSCLWPLTLQIVLLIAIQTRASSCTTYVYSEISTPREEKHNTKYVANKFSMTHLSVIFHFKSNVCGGMMIWHSQSSRVRTWVCSLGCWPLGS